MINEEVLRSVLHTQTEIIYNLLEDKENSKTPVDDERIIYLKESRDSLLKLINEQLIR
jgi:hypothetical protein